jgi:electron transport protein HydN
MNRFVIAEPRKCIGCRTCEIACVLAHPGAVERPTLTAANFAPRLRVVTGARVSTPVQCRQCEDAPCLNVCPNGAIVYRQNSVQVVEERCVGCKTCVMACPFGAMTVVSVPVQGGLFDHQMKAQAQKCDLCLGRGDGPACISVCPTKALHLVDDAALAASLRQRQDRAALQAACGISV